MRAVELEHADDTISNYVRSTTEEPIIFLVDGKPYAALTPLGDTEAAASRDILKREVLDTLLEAVVAHALEDERAFDEEIALLSNNPEFVALLRERETRYQAEGGHSLEEVRQRLGLISQAGSSHASNKQNGA